MSDILVVKVNAMLKQNQLNDLKLRIEKMKKTGVVLLPKYCDALIVPEDCEIKIKDYTGHEAGSAKLKEKKNG